MPAEAFRPRVAQAGAAPAPVPPEAAVEPGEGVGDADAVAVVLNEAVGDAEEGEAVEEAAEDAEDAAADGGLLLEDGEEPQPATSVAATSATPVSGPRWIRADSAI
jgi:hypothetical protein